MTRPKPVVEVDGGDAVASWIERHCLAPNGNYARLTKEQREQISRAYAGVRCRPVEGPLAAYLALYHLAGPRWRDPRPPAVDLADPWLVWRAACPELAAKLRWDGIRISHPGLGKAYPARRD